MKVRKPILALAAASILAVSGLALAQTKTDGTPAAKPPKSTPKATEAMVSGTVASMDADGFTLEGKKGTKGETFKMNSSTTKTGTLTNGAKVTVHYKMDGGDKVATRVNVTAPKPAKASTSDKPVKKP